MDQNQEVIKEYKQQLIQINAAISNSTSQEEIDSLISLKTDIQQLLSLTDDSNSNQTELEDEYANFMAEMAKEGAYGGEPKSEVNLEEINKLKSELEGMKCKAPHKHSWGEITYHNAMISSVLYDEEIKVKVMFLNPTHLEMLPCPYFLETECKFSEEKCRFSHGEIVPYSEIKSYLEPKFENVKIGTKILAKKSDKLWYRGHVKKIYDGKCFVGFDSKEKDLEVEFKDLLPLDSNKNDEFSDSDGTESESDDLEVKNDEKDDKSEIINMSLMLKPTEEALGSWEKYTRGIGGKLMSKMGYIIGSGLGKYSNGRLEPVSAVILPPGKSLDHCMHLREKSGGDKNLFSVERKMKRLQKRQEKINEKLYEKEKNKTNVFDFLNDTLTLTKNVNQNNVQNGNVKGNQSFRDEIKGETSRSLNVSILKIEEEVKRIERELFKIKDSLTRHQRGSQIYKSLKMKQHHCLHQIQVLEERKKNIKCEQSVRSDKKKLTIF
ncbi:zinc finger CCCH-type with G patch domain-containing protein [Onthophagus taurus]|uniref:zinc finger CCCH-type with G patch domain-containing protein n=1 Tax=Onthophagus taurus TaxID=166361 RepID=UPI0039BDAB1C